MLSSQGCLCVVHKMTHLVEGLQVERAAPAVDGAEVGALPVRDARIALDVANVESLTKSIVILSIRSD